MPVKNKIVFLLITGVAATAYGMLSGNNFFFIAGILLVTIGYYIIRRNLKSRQQNRDTPEIEVPSEDE